MEGTMAKKEMTKVKRSKGEDVYELALAEERRSHPRHERSLRLLQEAHRNGDARASYALGTWKLHGTHVRKDVTAGASLVQRAAAAGVRDAVYDLAVCFELGAGVKRDNRRALMHYVQAALMGDRMAAHEVGRCYYYGVGCKSDRVIARVWLDHAKALGIAP